MENVYQLRRGSRRKHSERLHRKYRLKGYTPVFLSVVAMVTAVYLGSKFVQMLAQAVTDILSVNI